MPLGKYRSLWVVFMLLSPKGAEITDLMDKNYPLEDV